MSSGRSRYPLDDAFDVELADRLAHFETYNKHHYRPNTYLHKWWGRRCGSTFRLILKGLVTDPSRQGYYTPGGLEGKLIFDPMMGGGTTLHEAIRLGANVAGGDVDPIPVLQARASLTAVSLPELERAFLGLFHSLHDELGWLFTTSCPTCQQLTEVWHVLYGLCRRCPCGEVVVVDALGLRDDTYGRNWSLCRTCDGVIETPGDHIHGCPRPTRLIEKGTVVCSDCGEAYEDAFDLRYDQRYVPLVIVGECPVHGLFHKPLDSHDRTLLAHAAEARDSLPLPRDAFAVEPGDKSIQLVRRGIDNYLDLFSSRQLMILARAVELLPLEPEAVRLNLALLLSTSLEFNSLLCGYKGVTKRRAGAVRHAFSHHAYAFPYTALETNPLYSQRASGTWKKLFYGRIERGRRWAARPRERLADQKKPQFVHIPGECDEGVEVFEPDDLIGERRFYLRQGSSVSTTLASASVDAVVTDPPYYDSIQYTDLAAYFRVWLRCMLPDRADWDYDAAESAVDPERRGKVSRYTELLSGIFRESRRVLKPDGRLVFTFHHWKPEAWASLTLALHSGGFALVNRYVVHAEHPISVHISNMRALTHDAILVCAPRETVSSVWTLPDALAGRESRTFCQGCADALGWLLAQSEQDEAALNRRWADLLGG